jgi:hypothetical protein
VGAWATIGLTPVNSAAATVYETNTLQTVTFSFTTSFQGLRTTNRATATLAGYVTSDFLKELGFTNSARFKAQLMLKNGACVVRAITPTNTLDFVLPNGFSLTPSSPPAGFDPRIYSYTVARGTTNGVDYSTQNLQLRTSRLYIGGLAQVTTTSPSGAVAATFVGSCFTPGYGELTAFGTVLNGSVAFSASRTVREPPPVVVIPES